MEKSMWKKDKYVAGCDEVGRGCFAGPIVTGCVVFPKNIIIPKEVVINDSKKLSPRQREKAEKWIKENALSWGIGEQSAQKINHYGLSKATRIAFRKSISDVRKKMNEKIDFLLMDAFFVPYVSGLAHKKQRAIIHGDEKSISIAAASIIAKVYRDKKMQAISLKPKYKKYGWGTNKGYGTKEHQEAIKKYGTTYYHRKQFVETFLKG